MGAIINQLVEFAVGMWRFRWVALGMAWFAALGSWLFVYTMEDEFEAASKVYLDTETVLEDLLDGLQVQQDVMTEVTLMTKAMLSRPQLERVARATDLDLRVETRDELEDLLESLQERIKISGGKDKVFSISFTDSNRQKAVDVVQTLLDTFVEDTLGSGQEDSIQAEQTLKGQIREYEERLSAAEERLKEFKKRNIGRMPSDMGDYYTQLQTAIEEMEYVRQEAMIAKSRRDVIKRQLAGEEPTLMGDLGAGRGPEIVGATSSSYDRQINVVESQLQGLLVEYTERHPEVVRLQAVLDSLNEKRDIEVADGGQTSGLGSMSMGPTNSLEINPVYQSLRIAYANQEVEYASLQATFNQRQERVSELQTLVNVVPEVEAELSRLNRDYSVVKERYETMLERMEDLQTSRRVKQGSDQVQFRIIDPPFATLDPVGPNRPLFLGAILIVALGLGVALAFVLNQLQPVYSTRKGLELDHDVPVIGTCDLFLTGGSRMRRRIDEASITLLVLGLFVACAVAIIFSDQAAETVQRVLENLISR